MDDSAISNTPAAIPTILSETRAFGFDMISEPRVGSLLAGMDPSATLDTVDNDPRVVAVAQGHLDADPRIRFHIKDGGQFLQEPGLDPFDLIYADAWPGKPRMAWASGLMVVVRKAS
jgi:predicted O-methyltransferase YrrM